MVNPTLELMEKITGFEALQKINVISSKAVGRFSKLQMDLATFGLESSLAGSSLLSDPEKYKNIFSMDSEFMKLYKDQFVTMSQMTTNMFSESSDELFSIFDNITPTIQSRPDVKVKSSKVAKSETSETSAKSAKKVASKKSTISKTVASTSKAKRKPTVKKSK